MKNCSCGLREDLALSPLLVRRQEITSKIYFCYHSKFVAVNSRPTQVPLLAKVRTLHYPLENKKPKPSNSSRITEKMLSHLLSGWFCRFKISSKVQDIINCGILGTCFSQPSPSLAPPPPHAHFLHRRFVTCFPLLISCTTKQA